MVVSLDFGAEKATCFKWFQNVFRRWELLKLCPQTSSPMMLMNLSGLVLSHSSRKCSNSWRISDVKTSPSWNSSLPSNSSPSMYSPSWRIGESASRRQKPRGTEQLCLGGPIPALGSTQVQLTSARNSSSLPTPRRLPPRRPRPRRWPPHCGGAGARAPGSPPDRLKQEMPCLKVLAPPEMVFLIVGFLCLNKYAFGFSVKGYAQSLVEQILPWSPAAGSPRPSQ